jgi:hypothetical protein
MTQEPASESPATVASGSSSAEPAPEPARAPPRASMVIAPVLVLLAAAATFPLWRDQAGFPTPGGGFEIENLRAELSAATTRLAQLEARPVTVPAPQAPAAAPAAVDESRLIALEQGLRALQAQPALPSTLIADVESLSKQLAELRKTAADSATMLRLVDRIDQVEAAIRELQAKRSSGVALLLAVGQLREAVALGQPFDSELRTARVLAGDDAALLRSAEIMAERAGSGLPPRSTLIARFDALAPAIIRAEILPADDGWQRRVMDHLLALITIRREDGNAAGGTAAAIVARTQAALNRNDLAAAIVELSALEPAAAAQAAAFVADAKARLAADKALSEMAAQAVALAGAKP